MFMTIKNEAVVEIIEKKSRFIGHAFIVENEDQIEQYLLKVRKDNLKANHNCYAYLLENGLQKFSDDGEPGSTAGRPIFDVISGNELKNVLIIVTRYFGGTLLGTGGLVRAYSRAAKEVIVKSGLIKKVEIKLMCVACSYAEYGKVEYLLKSNNYVIRDSIFTDSVEIWVEVNLLERENFKKFLIDQTNNSVTLIEGATEMISIDL
ncbi:MAG: YigZ family protein [Candidatus Epulonipiscioides saccharophilum]|nr:MAG: YigZ family protein [Epulopiscium sp. AS2M-Bin001]